MTAEGVHFFAATDALFRRIQAAAKAAGVLDCDWVRDAVIERLDREDRSPAAGS